MFNLSIAEPEDFEFDHFPLCLASVSEYADCSCDRIERDLREDFKAMTRECY